ncbi:hypothetical protein [Gephyromycinifex aptenodytis]|uniref:hypothetical protein n=1 Tax=Gephyromycinifex aptenodytis TaxID=2716227 RepID=UPI001444EFD4|nr:hypothetical protein [Gephyromycinifex aptenodytis]
MRTIAGLAAIAAAALLAAALFTKDPTATRNLRLAAGGLLLAVGVGIAIIFVFMLAASASR